MFFKYYKTSKKHPLEGLGNGLLFINVKKMFCFFKRSDCFFGLIFVSFGELFGIGLVVFLGAIFCLFFHSNGGQNCFKRKSHCRFGFSKPPLVWFKTPLVKPTSFDLEKWGTSRLNRSDRSTTIRVAKDHPPRKEP